MSHKSPAIAERIAHLQGHKQPAHLLGWLECFNSGEFYEAHDVLEDLWLEERETLNANFYKGLIQLAGAFVHLKCTKIPITRQQALDSDRQQSCWSLPGLI